MYRDSGHSMSTHLHPDLQVVAAYQTMALISLDNPDTVSGYRRRLVTKHHIEQAASYLATHELIKQRMPHDYDYRSGFYYACLHFRQAQLSELERNIDDALAENQKGLEKIEEYLRPIVTSILDTCNPHGIQPFLREQRARLEMYKRCQASRKQSSDELRSEYTNPSD